MQNDLKANRLRLGLSQASLAERVGVSRQAYSAVESGESVPSTELALRLAAALGRSVEDLFTLGAREGEAIRARWSGARRTGGRNVRIARVGTRTFAFDVADTVGRSGPADGRFVGAGDEEVEVRLLEARPPETALVAVGCDPAFSVVVDALRRQWAMEILWLQRGSRAALEALARGEAHIAGVHLHDPQTGEYNGPWIERQVPFPCTRIQFADWEQGIIVASGNPLGIGGVEDLLRSDLRFLNREEGSGTRLLLDQELWRAGVPAGAVGGYGTGALSHMAVAEAVFIGLVDAGVGIRAAAAAYGLDLLPLRQERYELVVPDHFLDLPAMQALLSVIRGRGVRDQVDSMEGYDASGIGLPV
jgi:putative molybdopterin biosynthesis protein